MNWQLCTISLSEELLELDQDFQCNLSDHSTVSLAVTATHYAHSLLTGLPEEQMVPSWE